MSVEAPEGPRSVLSALFAEGGDPAATLRRALESCGQPASMRYSVETVPDDDWVRRSQSQFTPITLQLSPYAGGSNPATRPLRGHRKVNLQRSRHPHAASCGAAACSS